MLLTYTGYNISNFTFILIIQVQMDYNISLYLHFIMSFIFKENVHL